MFKAFNIRIPLRYYAIVGGLILILLVGWIDRLTGFNYELSIFYILPIFLLTWFAGRPWGFLASIASAGAWLVADVPNLTTLTSKSLILWNIGIKLCIFFIITFLLNRIKEQQYQLSKLAGQDPLTGLANRRSFYEAANMEIHKARRYASIFTVAYIDVDDFKRINDAYGHNTGDKVLRLVANVMRQNTRIVDLVARMGGDEFVILFPETDPKEAKIAVQKVQRLLLEAMQAGGYPATFSIGVVTFTQPPISLDVMIEMVDHAMYTVKQTAKNNILYEESEGSIKETQNLPA